MGMKLQLARLHFIVSNKIEKLHLRFFPGYSQRLLKSSWEFMPEDESKIIESALLASDDEEEYTEDEFEVRDDELFREEPILIPHRTLLYGGGYHNKNCNFLTANRYRNIVKHTYYWAVQQGFNTFVTDLATPFGLLAMETLLDLRSEGEDFALFGVRSKHFVQRKSYRLIQETAIELAILEGKCDFSFHYLDDRQFVDKVLSKVGLFCNSRGICTMRRDS